MSLEFSLLPLIFVGGGNPFGSLTSFENSKPTMEFEEARVRNNKLGERRISRECSTCEHHTFPPFVVLGLILKNMDIGPTFSVESSSISGLISTFMV